jgi:flavin-dependent dehydrogenase
MNHDVIIIGGGPAGSTTATLLADAGYSALVLEKEKFPREHVGESLLPFCYHILHRLGVLEQMKLRYVRKPSVRFADKAGNHTTNWCFSHVIKDSSYLSFQVDRKSFDTLLLNRSRDAGAHVIERSRVTGVELTDQGLAVSAVDHLGANSTYGASFLVDASGRDGFLASRNRWRLPHKGFERTAIWSHFTNPRLTGGLEEGSSVIIYLGGGKRGWIWIFPLERNRVTAGVVMDSFYLRERKKALVDDGSSNWQLDLFNEEINESPLAQAVLAEAELVMPLVTEGDYSYYSTIKFGERFALVGDSGRFIDPIFSSGIYLSMKSAALVADALDGMLKAETWDSSPLAKAYEQINGAYDLVYNLISLFYNPHSVSFAGAASLFANHAQHKDAMAAGHFILSGDFFEDHNRYNRFFELLKNPRYFDIYMNKLLDPSMLGTEACEPAAEAVFPTAAPFIQ